MRDRAEGASAGAVGADAWEFHLYGGFDIRSDAQDIYLAGVAHLPVEGRTDAGACGLARMAMTRPLT